MEQLNYETFINVFLNILLFSISFVTRWQRTGLTLPRIVKCYWNITITYIKHITCLYKLDVTEEDIKKLNNEGFVTMKKNKVGSFSVKNKNGDLSSCHQDLGESNSARLSARHATETWLHGKVETMSLNFHYFLTLSFAFGSQSTIKQ